MQRWLSSSSSALSASRLVISRTSQPKPKLPNHKLVFGRTFTDHILEVDWDVNNGWGNPVISPYHKFELDPAISALHYALQAFEGMKAYIDQNGKIRLFRPERNMERLRDSARRLCFPDFDGNEYLKCIKELIKLEKSWIPKEHGYSLYIRPTLISTAPYLGVGPATNIKLYTILCPVGPYYPEGFKPIKLFADPIHVRAWPGGSGSSKLGANYAPTILPQKLAAQKGYSQILWLLGKEGYVTEVGTMNQFFFWKNEYGDLELVTAPLDGTILPGITRDSILTLAKSWGEFKVSERKYTIHEVIEAVESGRMIEAFGAGTAAIVSPVNGIHYDGKDISIPLDSTNPSAQAGRLTQRLADTIMNIQYGKVEHSWSLVVD